MKLYDAAWAPNPRRVRIFLAEKGIEIERELVDLKANAQLEPAYLGKVPRGVVPALELDDGAVLTESVAICRYLEALHSEPPLFGADPRTIGEVEEWVRRIEAEGYAAAVYAFRNVHPAFAGRAIPGHGPAIPQVPELAQRGAMMWGGFVASLEARLAEREWIAGEGYSFADIVALTTIDFARAAKLVLPEDARQLRAWHARASARPSAAA